MKTASKLLRIFITLFIFFSQVYPQPALVSAKAVSAAVDASPRPGPAGPETAGPTGEANPSAPAGTPGWTVIMAEDFEGNFPQDNGWALSDDDGTTNGEYFWGATTYRHYNGLKSGWPAVGGRNGYDPSTNANYPKKLANRMVLGPYDLTGVTAAHITYAYYVKAGFYAGFGVSASLDNVNYDAMAQYPDNGGVWETDTYDLANVDGGGTSYLGKPQVWIAFGFRDQFSTVGEGAYLDDIVFEIQRGTPPTCYTLTTAVSPASSGAITPSPAPNCNGGTQYTAGTVVQLTAAAGSGYTFANWTGDITGTTNPASITMNANHTVTANFNPVACYTLTTAAAPLNSGSVTANPAPNCNGTQYTAGTVVQLSAAPATGYTFGSWSGDASGSASPTPVTMSANRSVTANFTQQCFTLTTAVSPAGGGAVNASPAPNCNGTQYTYGTQVQLTAAPAAGYSFGSWSGGASGSANPATVTMNSALSVTATFTQQCFTLTTAVSPAGGGTITPDVAPNCNSGTQYTYGTVVHLTAAPAAGYTFSGWSGAVNGTTNPETVTMTAARSVTATFTQQCFTLTTAVSPAGAGTITADVPGNCNNGTQYTYGTAVHLSAAPAAGYTFANWSGDAGGSTSPVTVTMTANRAVTATFTQQCFTLTTNVSPAGAGTVTPDVAGNCNNGTQYAYGTQVHLTAAPAAGYTFNSWTGDAGGTTSPATVTMTANRSVTATFTQQCYTLTTAVSPAGSGTITPDVAPNCAGGQYTYGTQVHLTAAPATGYSFSGWTGAVTGTTNPATVTMTANQSLTATFTQQCFTLTTAVSPAGGGVVNASPAPNCAGSQYTYGTQVQINAAPAAGYTFAGWTGVVTGTTNPETVTMTANRSVTATFTQLCYTLTTAVNPAGGGSITPDVARNCNNGTQYTYGTVVKLTPVAADGYTFTGWSGDANGATVPASVTMTADHTVTATFTQQCFTLTTAVDPAGSGSVSASPAPNCAGGKYTYGTSVQLTPTPAASYTFASWSGAVTGSAIPAVVNMTLDRSVTATFAQQCYTLTTAVSPAGSGTISASPAPNCANGTQYTQGTVVQLTAVPAAGYAFASWSGAVTGTVNPSPVTMSTDRSVTADFTQLCYTLTTAVDPAGGGTITPDVAPNCAGGTKYTYGTTVHLTAAPATGYSFTGWDGAASGTTNPATVTMTGDRSVTASFAQQCFTLTTAVNPAGGGTITPDVPANCANGTQYTYGTVVKLTAAPATGYTFSGWTGDATGTTNPASVTMTANHTVTAGFTQLCYTLTTTVSPAGGGTITPDTARNCNNGTQYAYGTVVHLTAAPAEGYTFSGWTGAVNGVTNPASVTMTANQSVTATFTQQCFTLSLAASPAAGGTVTASPAANCNAGTQYTYGTQVQLTAAPAAGYHFGGWSGDATGSANPVTVTMTANAAVTANFTQAQCYTLTTTLNPISGGSVNASPAPNCAGGTQYTQGTVVQLTAVPAAGYTFGGWSGAVSGANPSATVTMNANQSVEAAFNQQCFTLTTAASPAGSGSITPDVAPNCAGGTKYTYGTVVKLTAAPAAGYSFSGWTGAVNNSTNPATVTMTADQTLTANFAQLCYTLTTHASPAGGGTITPDVAANCANGTQYTYGTVVKLTAAPAAGYTFTAWSGDANGAANPASVTMTADHTVTATFTQQCFTLTTSASPAGGGTVTPDVARNCNNGTQYTYGTVVKLTAAPAAGYDFSSWSGDANGTTNPVTVTMTQNHTVTAEFTQQCFILTTTASPAAGGTITPDVPANCANGTQYTYGTVVKLTAAPAAGYTFSGWTGAVNNSTNPATVTMTADRTLTATFTQLCYTLTTAVDPAGGGTITPDVARNCNNGTQYTYGTVVHLTAAPATGYSFTSWDGAASGTTNPATVTMLGDRSVTASFAQQCFTLTTTVNPAGGGAVTVDVPANCNNGTQYTYGTAVKLTAAPAAGYAFSGWTGAVTGATNPATVSMTANQSVTAGFTQLCYTLTTAVDPAGSGTITPDTARNCNNGTQYTYGTVVHLTAAPAAGYSFNGWTGAVTGTTNPATVTMTANQSLTATFTQLCYTLTTTVTPAGSGTITPDAAPNCAGGTKYTYGTVVKLTAAPAEGYTFSGWSGAVTNSTNPATVTMTANQSLTATFTQQCFTLTTAVSPAGGGTLSGDVARNCNSGTQYTYGTVIHLTAAPAAGYHFGGWSGDVTGSANPATVTMTANRTLTANFTQDVCYTLTTTASPAAGGTVTASPAPDCAGGTQYKDGTVVELTAAPAAGYTFGGWGGAASGTALTVTVTMNANQAVTAAFIQQCFTLTKAVDPAGSGTITADVAANCNNGTQYAYGTVVKLTAAPATGYSFTGWTGAVTGAANPITVTMTANRSVTAAFTHQGPQENNYKIMIPVVMH